MNRLPELKLNQTVQKFFTVLTIWLKMPVSDSQRMELFFFSFLPFSSLPPFFPFLLSLPPSISSSLPPLLFLSFPSHLSPSLSLCLPAFRLPLLFFPFFFFNLMKEHDSKRANCLFVYRTCTDKRKHVEIFFLDSSLQSASIDPLVMNYNLQVHKIDIVLGDEICKWFRIRFQIGPPRSGSSP